MTTTEYVNYLSIPFQNKALVLLATINGFFFSFIEQNIGISLGILSVYFILAVIDMVMGIYKNVFKNKKDFKSELFLKKILSVGVMVISVASITQLIAYIQTIPIPAASMEIFQSGIVYVFNIVKIFLVVAFLTYEATSIRENSVELKWTTVTGAIDIFLLPLTWLKKLLQQKITNEPDTNA